jgi:hypothetical protein
MQRTFFLCVLCSFLFVAGCSTLVLKPADFSWPIESVLKVNDNGVVQDQRHSFSVNVKGLFFAETKDSTNIKVPVRIIRDSQGYYFITAQKFKNVYVFEPTIGGLKLVNTILVKPTGMESPAMNQRSPYIQLINENDAPLLLTKDGIEKGGKK